MTDRRTARLSEALRKRASAALDRAGALRPRLTVLVDEAEAASQGLDETLDSVRAQPEARLEILVAPRAGDLGAVVERHVAGDRRVAVGASPRGSFVLLLTAGARLLPGAVRALLDAVAAADADAVVGRMAAPDESGPADLPAAGCTHRSAGLAEPGALLVSRQLWERAAAERSPRLRALAALLSADRREAVAEVVVRPPEPVAEVFGAMVDPTPLLPGWVAEQRRALELLAGHDLCPQWVAGVLTRDGGLFLDATERLDGQWAPLSQLVAEMLRAAQREPSVLLAVPVETRVKAWLAAHGRRADLERFVVRRRLENGQFPTALGDGTVRALLPVVTGSTAEGPAPDVPDWCVELDECATPLVASLRGARWVDGAVQLDLFAFLRRVSFEEDPLTEVALVAADGRRVPLRVEQLREPAATRFGGSRFHDHDRGAVRATVEAPHLLPPGDHALEVTVRYRGLVRSGRVRHRDATGSVAVFPTRAVGRAHLGLALPAGGEVAVRVSAEAPRSPARSGPLLDAVRLVEEGLELRGHGLAAADAPTLTLAGPRVRLAAPAVVEADGRWSAVVRLQADEWGLGERPAPSGRYRLRLESAAAAAEPAPGDRLGAELPLTLLGRDHRVQVRLVPRGGLEVVLAAPLGDEELGPFRQARLQADYATVSEPVDERLVYLQSYTGESTTDSPLAIHHELRRRRPDLSLVWGVADRSVPVPDGGRGVLWRSREWYDVLASAAHVVTNIEVEPWFRKRPGQRVLQTFHGYPSKTMGIGLWRAKSFTDSRIEQQLDRTSRCWDLLLTPAPEMDRYYRENYRYDGEILAAGYPRDDVLAGPGRDRLRAAARDRLGARPEQTVVLYAPTWRDDLATNFRSARMSQFLDVPAAAEALGPDYLLLLRGHRFHARGSSRRAGRSSRVLDVTDYPEINDLVLAADVAVLDYSSIRFDAAVAGLPMVFLVPDLGDYTGGTRGFLFDFRGSAPGPFVSSTDEVVDLVRDVAALRETYRDELDRFNSTYNYLQDGHAAERVVEAFFSRPAGPSGPGGPHR